MEQINRQNNIQKIFFIIFGILTLTILVYYFSNTIIHFTTPQQFPINSFSRFPLTWIIFPAEVFSLLFALYFIYCLVVDGGKDNIPAPLQNKKNTDVAILLPVYNEPEAVVNRTLEHVKKLKWPGKVRIYLLDDSTKDQNIKAMKKLGKQHGAKLIRRPDREGYKAGNVNNAVKKIKEEYFVIFDADQAPEPEFLERTMDHFSDKSTGFVQVPQHFIDETSQLERAAKTGSNIFYHAQCRTKARDGAQPFCGTNVIVRKEAFLSVQGFAYYTATEDFDLGLRMNEKDWRGAYVAEILVKGYTPPDFGAYKKQQYRWANGNMAVLRKNFLRILSGRFTLRYQIHTFFTLGWWLIGLVSLAYIIVPLFSLWFNLGTHHTWLPSTMIVLLYINVCLGIILIYFSLRDRTEDKITLKDALLQYSLVTNSLFIYARAAINVLVGRYVGFVTTRKTKGLASYRHIWINIVLGLVCLVSALYALYRGLGIGTPIAYRTYLPISLWLLFYALVLESSILFVGESA